MFSSKCYVLFGLLLLLTLFLDPTSGKRGFGGGHSYPKSGGLSGGGHRSGGLSGGGHGYPSSGGGHGYPSSGGNHGYPSSGGLSGGGHSSGGSPGYPSSGGNRGYPSSGGSPGYPSSGGSHGYPSSGGSHGYPSSSGGLSGNNRGSANQGHTTKIVNNYHYSPPQQITYTPVRGGAPVNYPVYRGQPPTYVYQYKNSDSKYGTLLAGLALMNLGTLGVATYAATRNHNSNQNSNYKPQAGEVCKFGVKKDNGDYEETRIDCQIISGFIMQEQQSHPQSTGTNSTITTTTTVTNMTTVNAANGMPEQPSTPAPSVLYSMLPNGTLVPVNATGAPVNPSANASAAAPNGTMTSSVVVTTTTTNTTLVNALDVKGKPVDVTPGMQCFVIRNSPTSNMRKTVPCGVLQTYADKSIRRNAASQHAPMFTVVAAIVAYCVAY